MEKSRTYLFFLSCLLLTAGLLLLDVIRIMPSIGMISIVLIGISYLLKPITIIQKADTKPFWALSFTFIILLPSYFYSDNLNYLLEKWQIALPYLLLPLAFMKIPRISERRNFLIYEFYLFCIFLVCLFAFGYYLLNQEIINQLYLESRVMPTLLSHHPSLSLMIVFAVYVSYWLFQSKSYFKFSFERNIFVVAGIFLFIFLHVFSVRSGLLAMYLVLFIELAKLAIQKKQVKNALLAGAVFILLGGVTLLLSPTFSNKIANTTNDLSNYQNKGSANNQSLGSRIISYKNGVRIAKESNWLFGCGLGDINDLNNAIFQKDYPDVTKPIIPHNQYLFYLAAIGIFGLILFCWGFYFPLFYKKTFTDSLFQTHMLIISIGFMFEAPLESQIGVAYSLLFILLPLHQRFGAQIFTKI